MPKYSGYYYSYFTKVHRFYDYRRGWLKGDCPICGREDKCGVHIDDDRIHCFVCSYSKSLSYAVAEIENIPLRDLSNFLKGFTFTRRKRVKEKTEKPLKTMALPDGYRSITRVGKVKDYLLDRGLHLDRLQAARVGYVDNPDSNFNRYIIFPYYNRKKLWYFQGRAFGDAYPKFKNPDEEIYNIGKGHVLYNIDALWMEEEINLVESVINVLTLPGRNTVGLGSKNVSPWQAKQLILNPVKIYNLMLDPDALPQAVTLASQLIKAGKVVRIIEFPVNEDVNSLGARKTMGLLKSQDTIYKNIMDLQKFKYGSINHRRKRSYFSIT